jgi:hypothetical protein
MAYEITYSDKNDEIQILEWIAPSSWSPESIRRAFYAQFSQAQIISLEAMQ